MSLNRLIDGLMLWYDLDSPDMCVRMAQVLMLCGTGNALFTLWHSRNHICTVCACWQSSIWQRTA